MQFFSFYRVLLVLTVIIITSNIFPQVRSYHSDCNLVFGSRILYSSDYSASMRQILEREGADVSGPGFFYGFDAGVDFRLFSSIYLHPNIRWVFSSVTKTERNGDASNSEFNSFVLPGIEAKMYFPIGETRLVYFGAGISSASFSTNYQFGVEPKGISETIMLGFLFSFNWYNVGMELGYQTIPMKSYVRRYTSYSLLSNSPDADFGGIYFSMNANIALFDYHKASADE